MRPSSIKVGDTFGNVEVVSYLSSKTVLVRFTDTGNEQWTSTQEIRDRTVVDRLAKWGELSRRVDSEIKRLTDDLGNKRDQITNRHREAHRRAAAIDGAPGDLLPGTRVTVGDQSDRPYVVVSYTPGLLVDVIDEQTGRPMKARAAIVKPI